MGDEMNDTRLYEDAAFYGDIVRDVVPRVSKDNAYEIGTRIRNEVAAQLAERDAEIARLRGTIAAVKRKAQKFSDIADDWQKLANEKPEDSPKSGGFARISSVYAVCAAELREVIGIE